MIDIYVMSHNRVMSVGSRCLICNRLLYAGRPVTVLTNHRGFHGYICRPCRPWPSHAG